MEFRLDELDTAQFKHWLRMSVRAWAAAELDKTRVDFSGIQDVDIPRLQRVIEHTRKVGNAQMQYVFDGGGQSFRTRLERQRWVGPAIHCPACREENVDFMHMVWHCRGHPHSHHEARERFSHRVSPELQALWIRGIPLTSEQMSDDDLKVLHQYLTVVHSYWRELAEVLQREWHDLDAELDAVEGESAPDLAPSGAIASSSHGDQVQESADPVRRYHRENASS
eukprot:1337812-Amphidinium_carterae.1